MICFPICYRKKFKKTCKFCSKCIHLCKCPMSRFQDQREMPAWMKPSRPFHDG